MNMINFVVIVVLLILIVRQISYIKTLEIRTKKSLSERLIVILCIAALIAITIFFAKNYMHYLIFAIATMLFVTDWVKQGISESGILIVSRGKELYLWNEIKYAQINTSDTITIDYYRNSGSKIISHEFKMKDYDRILEIFENNDIQFIIKNKIK